MLCAMKMRITLVSTCLLLVACGGGSSGIVCDRDYWDGTVGTCIPAGWDSMSREVLRIRGVPEETIVGFQRRDAVSGQFPTVAVTQERLPNAVNPADYSSASIRAISVLNGYEHVDTKEITVDGAKVSLHIFTGQPIEDEPKRRFYQVSTTKGDRGYTMTAVSPVSIDRSLEQEMVLILDHFTLSEPVKEE